MSNQPERERGARFMASTGVVLKVGRAPAWAITEVQRQLAKDQPAPPVIHNADRDRDEPNEADPDYRTALIDFSVRINERIYDVAVIMGTSILERPEDVPAPEDEIWRENLEAVGVPLSQDPRRRYLEWVKYVAAPANEDWQELNALLTRQIGTTEADVAEALETFRRTQERPADPERAGAERRADGDRVRPAAARPSATLRRARDRELERLPPNGVARPGPLGTSDDGSALPPASSDPASSE